MKNYLNFESDVKNLETELEKLKDPYNNNEEALSEVNTKKISELQLNIDKALNNPLSGMSAKTK